MGRSRAGRGRGAHGTRAGLTLVEVMFTIAILVVGMLGFARAIVGTMRAGETSREVSLATAAGRRVVETLQGTAFDQVWARFNADPGDDPVGPVSPGAAFAVPGLDPLPDDPDGFVGEIVFPAVDVGAGDFQLREDMVSAELGMPRDLNGDTLVDANDHGGDYRILPVIVRIRWRGQSLPGQVEFKTVVGDF